MAELTHSLAEVLLGLGPSASFNPGPTVLHFLLGNFAKSVRGKSPAARLGNRNVIRQATVSF